MRFHERLLEAWTVACVRELGEYRDMEFLRISEDGARLEVGLDAPDHSWKAPSGKTTHLMVITVDLEESASEWRN